MLLQATVVNGLYAFNACYYKLLMLVVTRYSYHKWFTQKRKPQIYCWFLKVLHILDQEKILFMVNKVTTGYWRGDHIFLVKVVCQKWKPQIDGSFLNVLKNPYTMYSYHRAKELLVNKPSICDLHFWHTTCGKNTWYPLPLPCSNLEPRVYSNHSQQYSVVTWFCTKKNSLPYRCSSFKNKPSICGFCF